ncbi:hypothetical protein ACJIZ3_002612 [Penstemon smallii]|uniref:Calcium uniporter protein C-terminal domain-containing protein n=1 Tax=Penstemon smallii TaxID=265156 RepID=A0ABD3U6X2_9LAMI
MALRRTLSKRLFTATSRNSPSPLARSLLPPPYTAETTHFRRQFLTTSDSFFRRFLQRRAINNHSAVPFFVSTLPVGDKLREKIKSLNVPPPSAEEEGRFGVTAADAKRVLRFVQMEKVRERLRSIPTSTIPYGEFVRICGDVCGSREMGTEFAKALDECGNVIVLGAVVFLRPDQVAKSMEKLITQSIAIPNDPRRKELDSLENQKALIDKKAQSLVRGELYCGLGFLVLQTLGFMRLTFWELSWDVMEPICFFVTSFHFALAYVFFLRTSKEPTFEGYFQRRFRVKQKKLMNVHNFDIERYNQLCEAFYPNFEYNDRARRAIFGSVHA